MSKRRRGFKEAARNNALGAIQYVNRFQELAVSMFEWINLPETVDSRFLEMTLFTDGQIVFFKDEALGFLALQNAASTAFNVYGIPTRRRAFAVNGYQRDLTDKDSVIIYNNNLHTNSVLDVTQYAKKLYNLDRIIDVNTNAQKTPVLVKCNEKQRLTLLNLYEQYEGNEPVLFGDSSLDLSGITCIKTDAPYVADKIYELKTKYWNEALTYLGIANESVQKKERLIVDEVQRSQGGTIASRFSRLQARKDACKMINEMFDLDIDVEYRQDIIPESERGNVENFEESEDNLNG